MKTKSLFVATLVTLMAMGTAFGKDEPRNTGFAVVPVKGSEIVKIIYKSEITGKIKLNLYDVQSKLIFTETLSGVSGFILPMNFAGLKAGEYTVELVNGAGKRSEKINYQPSHSKKQVHVSKLVNEPSKYLVSVTNASGEKISVKIYDSYNNLLHSETKQVEKEFAQLYTIKNAGNIAIEVSDINGNIKFERF